MPAGHSKDIPIGPEGHYSASNENTITEHARFLVPGVASDLPVPLIDGGEVQWAGWLPDHLEKQFVAVFQSTPETGR